MKEHKSKKHRRHSRERDSPDLPLKVPKQEPSENQEGYERQSKRKCNDDRHDRHRHSEDSRKESSRSRDDRDRNKDLDRERDKNDGRNRDIDRRRDHDRMRKHSYNVKIKEEQIDSDDARDRQGPSSSKWKDEDDKNNVRSSRDHERNRNYHDRDFDRPRGFRPESHDNRGGRGGRGGRGSRGGRGGRSRFFSGEEEDTSNMEWGKKSDNKGNRPLPPEDRDKPNFGLSGKLTEDTNTYKGIVIKYSEPPEARVPKRRWRLYPFKGEEALKVLYLHRASAYLMGRERKVVDIPLDHPSCSKQHAALQFRLVHYNREDGSTGKRIRPYIIDLESANGTFVNNNKIEPRKYVELLERDVLKFGFSSREYVLLHEHSVDEEEDDNMEVLEEK